MKVLGIDGGNVPGFCKRRQVARREEMVAHEAIRQNLDARKLRHAPQPLDEARTLLVSQVERAVRDPIDQVTLLIELSDCVKTARRYISFPHENALATSSPIMR